MGTGSQSKVRFYFDGKEIIPGEVPNFTVTDDCEKRRNSLLDFNKVSFNIKLNWWNRMKLKYFLWKVFRGKKKLILRAKSL